MKAINIALFSSTIAISQTVYSLAQLFGIFLDDIRLGFGPLFLATAVIMSHFRVIVAA